MRRSPGITWAKAVQVKPMVPVQTAATSYDDADAPVFNLDVPPLGAVLIPVRVVPPRTRSNTPPPAAAAPPESEKAGSPTIAVQLTPEETVAARQETSDSLNNAEKTLAATRGKNLNPVQTDLVSKIKGFLKDAREAAQARDWARARSLAKKAQVLSDQLAQSL